LCVSHLIGTTFLSRELSGFCFQSKKLYLHSSGFFVLLH